MTDLDYFEERASMREELTRCWAIVDFQTPEISRLEEGIERYRAALEAIIGEAEEVLEAQHGSPSGALEAIAKRARHAWAGEP